MNKSLLFVGAAAFAIGAGISIAAQAQPELEVYFGNNVVGRLEQESLMVRTAADNKMYQITIAYGGEQVDALFWFPGLGCTGQATLQWYDTSHPPAYAVFDGETLWKPNPAYTWMNAQSYSWFWDWQTAKVKDQCFNYNPGYPLLVSAPVKIEATPQYAPSCQMQTITQPQTGNTFYIPSCKNVLTIK